MTFNPDDLDPQFRAIYDNIMGNSEELTLDQWVGAAMSGLQIMFDSDGDEPVLRDMAVDILVRRAPESVKTLGSLYDAGLLS
jgi:hypothetical protein